METVSGFGTSLFYGDDVLANTPTYTEIETVESVTPPALTVGVTEVKWLKAPNRAVKKKPNWKNPGDVAVVLFYDKDQMADLYALVGIERAWKVELADGALVTFDGFISNFGQPQINGDDEVKIEMTLTTSGLPIYTPPVVTP